MRLRAWLLVALSGCGGNSTADAGPDAPATNGPLEWRELPEETLTVTCRPTIGAAFTGAEAEAPQHWWADATGVLLRTSDEGHTWTRAPLDTAYGVYVAGPVRLAIANQNPRTSQTGWFASPDRGATWQPLTWTLSATDTLPPASLVTEVGPTKVAWTPTGLVRYSTDGGQTWKTEREAPYFGQDWHAALGGREWLVDDVQRRRAYRSNDTGRTFTALETPQQLMHVLLVGAQGVAASTFEGGFVISRDDGATWLTPVKTSGAFAIGPGEGELWTLSDEPTPRLLHSLDFGDSFAPVRVSLGAAGDFTAATPRRRVVHALPDGRKVLALELPGLHALSTHFTCVESSTGALDQPAPAKDETLASVTLWAEGGFGPAPGTLQQVVPLAEPGNAYWLMDPLHAQPDVFSINGGTRTVSGSVALLLQPREVVDRGVGPPMFVRELDPVTLQPMRITQFDNLLELDNSGQAKMLRSHWLFALPDDTFRTNTAEGDSPVGVPTAMWAPWNDGLRWGPHPTSPLGAAAVRREDGVATTWFRLSRNLAENDALCDEAALPTLRCIEYAGKITDWAHRDENLYVLDGWRGEVLEADFGAGDGVFHPVVVGLAKPTSLFVPIDDNDRGVYVVDTHLYRFVPGITAGRRP